MTRRDLIRQVAAIVLPPAPTQLSLATIDALIAEATRVEWHGHWIVVNANVAVAGLDPEAVGFVPVLF